MLRRMGMGMDSRCLRRRMHVHALHACRRMCTLGANVAAARGWEPGATHAHGPPLPGHGHGQRSSSPCGRHACHMHALRAVHGARRSNLHAWASRVQAVRAGRAEGA